MPWAHLGYGNEKIKELSTKFEVQGIPAFIILKANGDLITKDGRGGVS